MAEKGNSLKTLIAVDGSEHGHYAVQRYLDTLYKEDDEVLFVYIPPPLPTYEGISYNDLDQSDLPPGYSEKVRKWEKNVNKVRKNIMAILSHYELVDNADKYQFHVGEGDPGREICKIAKEEDVGLVIVASRGLGTIKKTILGSVSKYVLHHCHCSVMICKNTPPNERN